MPTHRPAHRARLCFLLATCLLVLLVLLGCKQIPLPPPLSPAEPVACPEVPTPAATAPAARASQRAQVSQALVIGATERVVLEPEGLIFDARIDTGAETSSFSAPGLTEFERDGKPWVSFEVTGRDGKTAVIKRPIFRVARIKRHEEESLRRPVVKLRVVLGPLEGQHEFTLADRSNYKYPVLIGRNFLRDVAIVDVALKNTQKIRRRPSTAR